MKLILGSHVSYNSSEGLVGSVVEALSYGSNTFMFYTGAPQNTIRSSIDLELTSLAQKTMKEQNIDINNVIIHAPYIINLANNKDKDKYAFATNFLKQELKRASMLGVSKVVLHPGSHVGLGEEEGIKNIVNALNEVITEEKGPIICLETMAGKGSEIGSNFLEIKDIIDCVNDKKNIGVCMDTCHLNDAGYDVLNFDNVLKEFDRIVGLEYRKCIHINDSKNPISSHKDRHENIGYGTIGFDGMMKIIYNDALANIPKILETPYIGSNPPYKDEIKMKEEFLKILRTIKRDGLEDFIKFLENTDFFTAPASTRFHGDYAGGLVEHSMKVYEILVEKVKNSSKKIEVSEDTLKIVALLHDVCKANFYKVDYRNAKNALGVWEKVPYYTVDDTIPYGHGEKSVMMITEYMKLTSEEKYAIRWHMGFTEPKEQYGTIGIAYAKYPLALLMFEADLEATYFFDI